jgi:glycosyltransferase involved in cell wall biosynthesis
MNILISSNYQWPHLGGIEIICEQLKQSWVRCGHTVTWVTTDIPRAGAPLNAKNVRLPAWNGFEERFQINCPVVSPFAFWRILRLVRQHDAVNVHSLAPGLTSLVILAALLLKKPLVITQQVAVIPLRWGIINFFQRSFINFMARMCVTKGAWLTFPVPGLLEYYYKAAHLPAHRLALTPNAYDKQIFTYANPEVRSTAIKALELPPCRLKVLFVGRFVEKKGLAHIETLSRRFPDIHFTLVGRGLLHPEHWGLPNVRVVDPLPAVELRKYFSAHDLLLLPSVGEGWPLVICESMACGTPCLISRETFDYFKQDDDMFLVADLNDASLAEILERCNGSKIPLLTRHQQLADYATATWDWDATASKILSLF